MAEMKKTADDKTAESENKRKALELALTQIEKQFGKGAIMRMDGTAHLDVPVIPTGSLA